MITHGQRWPLPRGNTLVPSSSPAARMDLGPLSGVGGTSPGVRAISDGNGTYISCDGLPPRSVGMVCCLGAARAFTAAGAEARLQPKALSMLVFLASAMGRNVSVAEVIEHLWEDEPPASARANIRLYVSRIRGLFGNAAVVRSHESLRLDPTVVPSDAYLLRRALDVASPDREHLTSLLECLNFALVAHAATTAAPVRFLDGSTWPALAGRFVADCFEGLPEAECDVLLPVLSTLRQLDPMNEALCSLHIRVLSGVGNRSGALAVYAEHRLQLSAELGISPSHELQALYQKLLSSEAEPSQLASPRVFELPSLPMELLGRSDELEHASAMLGSDEHGGSVLLVHGWAGVGKTSFAISLGHRMADRFRDGVVYVEMHGSSGGKYNLSTLLRVILRSIGVPLAELPDDVDRMQATYRSLMHARSLLVVLDDAPRGFDFSGLISAGSQSALCITAREPNLHVPARRHYHLNPLSLEVAAEILLHTTGLPIEERNEAIARSIVTASGGLPLASRILGGYLATNSFLTLEDLREQIRRPRGLLDSLEYGSLSVRQAIQSSLESLDERKILLLRVIVFARLPWVDLHMIQALYGDDSELSPTDIQALVRPRLIDARETDAGRYRFHVHDLVREVVKDALPEDGRELRELDDALLRILMSFQKVAASQHALLMGASQFNVIEVWPVPEAADSGPQVPTWQLGLDTAFTDSSLGWIEEYEEVVANLIEVASQRRWHEEVWRLAVTCALLFEQANLESAWRRTHVAVLEGARHNGDAIGEGAVLLELAELDLLPDRLADAEGWLDEALPIFERARNRKGLGVIEEKRGRIRFMQRRYADARRHLWSAVEYFDSPADRASVALVLRYLGQCHAAERDFVNAEHRYEEALRIADASAARRVEGQIYVHIALLAISRGQLNRARRHCRTAHEIFEALGDVAGEAHVLLTEARLLMEKGEARNALFSATRAEELALQTGDHMLLDNARSIVGELAVIA